MGTTCNSSKEKSPGPETCKRKTPDKKNTRRKITRTETHQQRKGSIIIPFKYHSRHRLYRTTLSSCSPLILHFHPGLGDRRLWLPSGRGRAPDTMQASNTALNTQARHLFRNDAHAPSSSHSSKVGGGLPAMGRKCQTNPEGAKTAAEAERRVELLWLHCETAPRPVRSQGHLSNNLCAPKSKPLKPKCSWDMD